MKVVPCINVYADPPQHPTTISKQLIKLVDTFGKDNNLF